MAFDGTLKFDTALDDSGFQSGIGNLESIAKKGLETVKNLSQIAADGIVSLGKQAIESGRGFEKSMSNVIATMGVTKDTVQDGVNSYDLLKKAAADAGESTTFSASQAADALNYLALAGYDAQKAAGALPAILDLAAAGDMDLAYASDLATDAMAALGIEANTANLTNFGDKLAKTASKANTSVSQLGEAILTVGGTAKSLANGTTELNASLGVLANRGIKGSEGGTALRNMILSLSAPTDKAKAKLDELGVAVLDETGNMRPLNETFKDLDKALSSMADGEKTQVLNDIFNKVDLKSANAMLAGCGQEFDDLANAINASDGAMSQMAKTMNDNLEGDLKSLESKGEAFYNTIYESMNDGLRQIVQLGGNYVSQLTNAFKNGGFDGLAKMAGDVIGEAVAKISGYLPKIANIATSLVSSLLKGLSKNAGKIAQSGIQIALELANGIGHILSDIPDFITNLVQALANGISQNQAKIRTTAKVIINLLANSLTSNMEALTLAGIQIIGDIAEIIVDNLPVLTRAGIAILETLVQIIIDNLDTIIQAGLAIIQMLCDALLNGENLEKLLDAGIKVLTAIANALIHNLDTLINIAVQIVAFLADELLNPDNLGTLLKAGKDILEKIGNGIINNIDDILLAVEEIIGKLCDELLNQENLEKLLSEGGKMLGEIIRGLCQVGGKLAGFAVMLFREIADSLAKIEWKELGYKIEEGIISGLLGVEFTYEDFRKGFEEYWDIGYNDLFPESIDVVASNGNGGGSRKRGNISVDNDALNAFRSQMQDLPLNGFQYSPTSQVVSNNYYNSIQNANAPMSQQGDLIIPVSIGGQEIETFVFSAIQLENMRSGGAFL